MLTTGLRWIAMGAIVVGLLLRTIPTITSPTLPLLTCDGRAYYTLAVSLAQGKGFYIEDPLVIQACLGHLQVGPSHHFAPALAVVEGAFVAALGDGTLALVVPLLLLSMLAVFAAWWTTRDLFGGEAALLVAAAISLEWTGVVFGTWLGYSENLVVISFTLTLWAVLKGLRDDRYLVVAGLFAGLGYLSKSSIGWFFLLAGLGGLAWRLLYRGRAVLRNRWYLAAIAVFAVPVAAWSLRNVDLFWDGTLAGLLDAWQTSAIQALYTARAFQQPALLAEGLIGKLPILLVGLILPFLPLLRRFAEPLRRWREEHVSGLWLAVGLIFMLGWFFAAVFWVSEQTSMLWGDPIRYIAPAQVPLLWLLVQGRRPQNTVGWTLSFTILAALSLSMAVLMIPGSPFAR